MKQSGMFEDDDRARARNTDPKTSHAAADSISARRIRESQAAVLAALTSAGPMHDEAILAAVSARGFPISPSGCRTRRSELVVKGLVVDTGLTVVLPSHRRSIVWRALG